MECPFSLHRLPDALRLCPCKECFQPMAFPLCCRDMLRSFVSVLLPHKKRTLSVPSLFLFAHRKLLNKKKSCENSLIDKIFFYIEYQIRKNCQEHCYKYPWNLKNLKKQPPDSSRLLSKKLYFLREVCSSTRNPFFQHQKHHAVLIFLFDK